MGTKTCNSNNIYYHAGDYGLKKAPQPWGRKPILESILEISFLILKKAPQPWGRKHIHYLLLYLEIQI